ncbi:MAG: DUF7594 domain-containing protein [Acidimicrobiia bacterium]
MNRRVLRLVAFVALLGATVMVPVIQSAGAATQTFGAEADAKVVQGSPTTNFATSSLDVSRTPVVESYVRFTVSNLTGVVQKATLRLFAFNGSNKGPGVYRSDPVWSETGINWNNRPVRTSGRLANGGRVTTNSWVDFDVTATVTGNGTYSFNVATDGKDDVQFNSREASTNKPQLFLTLSEPDLTPPDTVINSGPSGTVRADSVSFTFSATEAGSSFECSLDGAAFVVCSSPRTYPALSNAMHTFDVRATDPSGNTDPTPATRVFNVDPNAPGDPVLVGAGDIASCSSTGDEATAALLDSIDGSVFTVGDNVYESGTSSEFNNCYGPSWGRHKFRTRPVAGNHEYATSGAAGYYGYFGAAAGEAGKGYYSYNLGAWHVIVLNSNCNAIGGCGAGSAQDQWLRADLAASNAACTVAMWHHPLFSSGGVHGNNIATLNLWRALYEAGADLVLSGHEHLYERFAPQTADGVLDVDFGLRQFTAGMGGRSHYGVGTVQPNSEARNADTYGVLKLSLHTNSYDWEFVPEAGRTYTDSGTASCHGAPSTTPPPPPPPPPPPGEGPVTFRAASSDGSDDTRSSITIAKPAGTQPGDVMVAAIVLNDDDPAISTPVGWTLVRTDAVLNAVLQSVYVRVAGASEPASYTWSIPDFRRITGGISSYSGVDTSHPVDAHNGATDAGGGTSIIAPSITTTTPGAMILHLAAINAEGTISPPAGSTERWENHAFRVDSTRDALAESSDVVQAAAGVTGSRTATASQSGRNIGVLLALRPAP